MVREERERFDKHTTVEECRTAIQLLNKTMQ